MNERSTRAGSTPWFVEILLRNDVEHLLMLFVRVCERADTAMGDREPFDLPNEMNGSCASPFTGCAVDADGERYDADWLWCVL